MVSTPALLMRELTPATTAQEQARAFYQTRLSLYFLVIGGISLVFFLLHNLLEVLSGNLTFGQVFTLPLNHWHLAGALLSAALAGALRVGAPSATQLAWIDGAGCQRDQRRSAARHRSGHVSRGPVL
ncbi:MAG TPA: hypothetical protein VFN67_09590 [Polyangiales bacterium]|nr:hypothetical protein [Polyangiales bacterium]